MTKPDLSDNQTIPAFATKFPAPERKRLFISVKTGAKERLELVKWAAENKYDALVFSLGDKCFSAGGFGGGSEYAKLAKQHNFIIEAGGRDFSLLLPKRLFLFHRDLFRMEHGKRKSNHHFCPTNPETTSRIKKRARHLFSRVMAGVTVPRVFHLLPDEGHENTWCACPACRAFNYSEQNLITVNSAADALASIDPNARLSFFDYEMEPEAETGAEPEGRWFPPAGIEARENMFRLAVSSEQ
ncbi:MAG: hypothetical protein LBH44_08270 [Treponema sp.]|jgi:hypothetical protein|nr:hypothetical protein [Treponema sp.]